MNPDDAAQDWGGVVETHEPALDVASMFDLASVKRSAIDHASSTRSTQTNKRERARPARGHHTKLQPSRALQQQKQPRQLSDHTHSEAKGKKRRQAFCVCVCPFLSFSLSLSLTIGPPALQVRGTDAVSRMRSGPLRGDRRPGRWIFFRAGSFFIASSAYGASLARSQPPPASQRHARGQQSGATRSNTARDACTRGPSTERGAGGPGRELLVLCRGGKKCRAVVKKVAPAFLQLADPSRTLRGSRCRAKRSKHTRSASAAPATRDVRFGGRLGGDASDRENVAFARRRQAASGKRQGQHACTLTPNAQTSHIRNTTHISTQQQERGSTRSPVCPHTRPPPKTPTPRRKQMAA